MWKYSEPLTSNELYHHGILGQKWGVRRYQNKDGSLTPEGKERYNKGSIPSETTVSMFGRKHTLPITMMYPDEPTPAQIKAAKQIKTTSLDVALNDLKTFIRNDDPYDELHDSNDPSVSNVFHFIKPRSIYIPSSRRSGISAFAVICDYRYDEEHGLAIMYVDGKYHKVCSTDEAFTWK